MTSGHGEDLGYGVYVSLADEERLVVISPRLDFGWRAARGRVPGTAVLWREHPYEVVDRAAAGKGHRWVLRPWDESSAMRDVVPLDSASVAAAGVLAVAQRRGVRNRLGTMVLLPILGLAPARVQKRWEGDWFFPAELATWISAAVEILGGGVGLIQSLALAAGGEWFLPPVLRFMTVVGPLMVLEAIVRMVLAAAEQEPVGSVLGLPFALFEKSSVPVEPTTDPAVRLFDEDLGVLELVSPVNRIDWGHDGLLPYRNGWYRLDRADREGRSWTYRFTRCDGGREDQPMLCLRPPVAAVFVAPREASPPPSILKTTLVTAAVTLGPRDDQERWAAHLGVDPRWLTVAGALPELVGGLTNLGRDAATAGPFLVVLDVFFIVEGSLRLLAALGGRPMGSLFGWVLRPLYRSSLPPRDPMRDRSC